MRIICGLLLLALAGCNRQDPELSSEDAGAGEFRALSKGDLTFFHESEDSGELEWTGSGAFRLVGDGRGYAYTRDSYRDFVLQLEFRWPEASAIPAEKSSEANTGVLLFITGTHQIWPRCLEVQGKWTDLGQIKSNARDVSVSASENIAARERARKPVGEWNSLKIVARDGGVTSFLNGEEITASQATALREGPIGFQLEGFDVEFRNVEIRAE